VVASKVLATAFDREGKSAMAFPKFGFERRGAPVLAFNRFDSKLIREKTQIYHPHCVIVIDPHLMRTVNVFEGIKPSGILVLDAPESPDLKLHESLSIIGSVDATRIGLEKIGKPITNTCMLGAFARTTGWVHLDSILEAFKGYFSGGVLEANTACARRGFQETEVIRFGGK